MTVPLRDLYPSDLAYIKDQVDWLHHIWTIRPLCDHQTRQAERLREQLMSEHPEETGVINTLNIVLGYGDTEALDLLGDLF